MDFHTWLVFLTGVILICGSPGPNMLQVMASGATYGLKRAMPAMLGCFIPVFLMISASVAGVGVIIQNYPAIFDALRYAGAAYLIYVGVQSFRAPPSGHAEALKATSGTSLFKRGLAVGASNPKAMLFATAFFPQFLNPAAPQALQCAIMLASFGVVECSWYLVYASAGSRMQKTLERPSVQKKFNHITGSLFIAFGVAMAAKSR